MAVTQATGGQAGGGRETAQAGNAFDAAVSEFLAYPPSPSLLRGALRRLAEQRLRRTSLQGHRQRRGAVLLRRRAFPRPGKCRFQLFHALAQVIVLLLQLLRSGGERGVVFPPINAHLFRLVH